MRFGFVIAPVALNAVLMVMLAIAFNGLFPWRRYPAAFADRSPAPVDTTTGLADETTHRAVLDALREVDSFIDITEDDLIRLHRILTAAERRDDGTVADPGEDDREQPGKP
jgi:CBS-domain-containing membrane protein